MYDVQMYDVRRMYEGRKIAQIGRFFCFFLHISKIITNFAAANKNELTTNDYRLKDIHY